MSLIPETDQTLYGIIGNPVKHSLSPAMHNAAFQALGVEASYQTFPLEEHELEPFFKELKEKDCPIFGLNVTVPYKQAVLPFMDTCTPLVDRIGATNTIVINEQRKFTAYNTDAPGFLSHLSELKFDFTGKRIAILGAGGSARAIIATLCMIPERPESIRVYNRTASRVEELLKSLQSRIDVSLVKSVDSVDDLNIELSDLLINTTSVGLKEDDFLLVDPDILNSGVLVYDLIYNPPATELLQVAQDRGSQIANGLGMLYYQGVLAFQHWANIQLEEDVKNTMRQALEEAAAGL